MKQDDIRRSAYAYAEQVRRAYDLYSDEMLTELRRHDGVLAAAQKELQDRLKEARESLIHNLEDADA